ncbi:type II toxin-antitoxin system RelE/ParE family toxin [Patescibacteria group bacterium]|nr:type II toxin-antitoxin system RelE/ParE family toxin [Patescibacteria group bacterium]MBU3923138.1 type II toxin-antitoxin system RelE/ParE family toxin [Patescibacteria group bacterium]
MKIYYSVKFERKYKKLPKKIKEKIKEKEHIFRKNPFDKSLKTHKLSGKLSGLWAFSIDQKYRIIFELKNKNTIWLHSVGDHSVYKF